MLSAAFVIVIHTDMAETHSGDIDQTVPILLKSDHGLPGLSLHSASMFWISQQIVK